MRIGKYRWLIAILGFAIAFVQQAPAQTTLPVDTVMVKNDSVLVQADSVRPKSNALDAPVLYSAKDSMIMTMNGHNVIYMYGESSVQQTNRALTAEQLQVDANSGIVYATFALDSIGEEFGYPVYREGETQYEMRTARFNFKTKKLYATDIITQQGEGYVTAAQTKKMPNDDLYMRNGRYTTCDDHEHPDFYLQMTKAKVRPGKNIVTGPVYLVVEDVPLPVAVPFGFFPFTSDYSSGVIMPTYGDELARGFSLRNGGYYFAFSDYTDLALTGEYYTRGSWGLDAQSTYRKRYKFSGSFQASYRLTKMELEGQTEPTKSKDFALNWTHSQDAKANPFGTFSANVRFTTSSYNRNDLASQYSGRMSDNQTSSAISYSYRPPGSPFSFTANASINQTAKDSTLSMTLPNFSVSMRQIYPFQRKEQVGEPKWYEKINMSYTGSMSNSIQRVKESEFFQKNLIKDWRNGVQHQIPIAASFTLFKNITITPSINYNERWYFSRIDRKADTLGVRNTIVQDTTYGFYRIYDYRGSVSAQTKLYGMYKPWQMFGKWAEKTMIRHMLTPSVSFTGAPDFGNERYGYWRDISYYDFKTQQIKTESYSPFSHNLYGVPGKGKSGTLNFSLDNNLEIKTPIAGTDSTRKTSLIDQLRLDMGYNFLKDSMKWDDPRTSLRVKLWKNYTLSVSGVWDIYMYSPEGNPVNKLRINSGKSIVRFRGANQTFSYSFNNSTFKKWFGKSDSDGNPDEDPMNRNEIEAEDGIAVENPEDGTPRTSLRKPKAKEGDFDEDGYLLANIPWTLSVNYSIGFDYDRQRFNKEKLEYPYKIRQTLGLTGSISPTKNWSFNFNTSYDFEAGKFSVMQCSIVRQMHCWSMSASVIPIGPYQSYSFSIAVNSSLLKDLKYDQSSNSRDALNWGYN